MKCTSCNHNWQRTKLTEYITGLSKCPKCSSRIIVRNDFVQGVFRFVKTLLTKG